MLSGSHVADIPPLKYSVSEDSIAQGGMMRISENPPSFIKDREGSKFFLQQHLEDLKAAHRQQLQQTELQHQASLERRIQQNVLLTANTEIAHKTMGSDENGCSDGNSNKTRGGISMFIRPKRSSSTPNLSTKMNQGMSLGSQRQALLQAKETRQSIFIKEDIDWAECQKQFHVTPVPEHVFMSLYKGIVHEREHMRQETRQQRSEFLLSMQRPFHFHQSVQKVRLTQETDTKKQRENSKNDGGKKAIPKAVTDPAVSKTLREEEQKRKIRIQRRAQETLRASSAPIQSQAPRDDGQQVRTAQKTKSRVIGFLEQKPSFQPKTNAQVPDFDKLYQAFQRKTMERAEKREITLCQPFLLRTSTLRPRQRIRNSTDQSLDSTSKSNLKRSNSFGGLTSLSMDILPTYTTDAARKRSMAIRKSLEERDIKEQENEAWMKQHRINSQAISRAVAARAKAMDPHKTLKEVYQEKLKQHRKADQERVKDYKRDLREMNARVTARPYLFEQVSQKNAKSDAERRYKSTLEQAGLDENFVRSKGENHKKISKHEDKGLESDQHSSDIDTQQREGSGEDSDRNEEGEEA